MNARKIATTLFRSSSLKQNSHITLANKFNKCTTRFVQASAKSINHDVEHSSKPSVMDKVVNITVFDREGKVHQVPAYVGETLMDSIRRSGINMVPDSTCLGECACVGCHIIVSNDHEHKLVQSTDDETDILEEAPFVHENSRLACQVIVDKSIEGLVLALPPTTTDESMDPYFRF